MINFSISISLSAQDVDGWRPREHVAFLFSEDNEEFHNLIRKHVVTPFVLGDFYPGHSEEVAGGKYFAVVKPNPIPNAGGESADADVRGIVIGSTWRRCSASSAVAESVFRQRQFDVLAGKASCSYAMVGYRLATNSLDSAP